MDTNSSVSRLLTLALPQVLEISKQLCNWNSHARDTQHNHSFRFQTSSLTHLASRPSILGLLESPSCPLPAHQKEEMPYGSAQKTK